MMNVEDVGKGKQEYFISDIVYRKSILQL